MDMSPERIDPVSGNEIPLGATAENVRDDIPAQLSEGEYVVPADVVNYYGVKFFEDLRSDAKEGYQEMAATGRIGGEPIDDQDAFPFSLDELATEDDSGYNAGGVVQANEGIYAQRPSLTLPSRTSAPAPASVSPVAPVAPAAVTTSVSEQAERRAGRSPRSTRQQSPYLDPLTGLLRPEAPSRDYRAAVQMGSDAARRPDTFGDVSVDDLPGLTRFTTGGQPVFLKSGAVVPTSQYADLYQTDLFYDPDTMQSLRRTKYKPTGQYIGDIPEGYVPYTNTIGMLGNVFPQDGSAPTMNFMEYQRALQNARMARQAEGAIFDPRDPNKQIDRSFMKDDLSLFDQVNWESMTDADELRDAILNVRLGVGSEGPGTRVGQFGGRFASGETNRAVGQVERLLQAAIAAGDTRAQNEYGKLLYDIRQELKDQGLDKNNDGLEDTAVQKSTPGFGEDPLSVARGQDEPTQAEFMGITPLSVPEVGEPTFDFANQPLAQQVYRPLRQVENPTTREPAFVASTPGRVEPGFYEQKRLSDYEDKLRATPGRGAAPVDPGIYGRGTVARPSPQEAAFRDKQIRDAEAASRQLRDLGIGVPKRLPDTPDIRVQSMADPVSPEAFMQRRMRGFNEGGQVSGYQDGGVPVRRQLDTGNDTPSFEVDPAKLRNREPGAFTFNGQPATPGDGSSFERAAENRRNISSFFRNLPGTIASAANPANYIPSAEQRAANIAANEAAAAERRAANAGLASSFQQAAATPQQLASNAATMFHRMGGGAEKDAYDAGFQAGYQKGLSEGTSSGKAEVRTRMAGATRSMDAATAEAPRGPVAPMSQYTLRQGTASRVGQGPSLPAYTGRTMDAATAGMSRGLTAAQAAAARDPIPSQPGVAQAMDPIPSQPSLAAVSAAADPIPGAPDLVPTPQGLLDAMTAPIGDVPSDTFDTYRMRSRAPQPAAAPVSVDDEIAALEAELGMTASAPVRASGPNFSAMEKIQTNTNLSAVERAQQMIDLLQRGAN